MSVRALEELARHYHGRHAPPATRRSHGGKVVGYLGTDVPRELLLAADLLPVRVSGDPRGETSLAERYAGPGLDPVTRSQLNRLLDGTYAWLDYLVIGHDHHGLARLFYTLREIQRVEPVAGLPRFHFLDLLHLPYRTSAIYSRKRLSALLRTLEEWTGASTSRDAQHAAIAEYNATRRLLQRVAALRTADPPRLTGVEGLEVIGAGMCMPPADYTALLEDLLAHTDGLAEHPGTRVFLTGSGHDSLDFYTLLESRGAVVVGEDHDWGDRSYSDVVDESIEPIDALVDRAHLGAPGSAKRGIVERAAYTTERAIAAHADVAISFILDGDDAPAWDTAAQRERLAAHGVPLLVLAHQPYGQTYAPEAMDRLAAFLASSASRQQVSV